MTGEGLEQLLREGVACSYDGTRLYWEQYVTDRNQPGVLFAKLVLNVPTLSNAHKAKLLQLARSLSVTGTRTVSYAGHTIIFLPFKVNAKKLIRNSTVWDIMRQYSEWACTYRELQSETAAPKAPEANETIASVVPITRHAALFSNPVDPTGKPKRK